MKVPPAVLLAISGLLLLTHVFGEDCTWHNADAFDAEMEIGRLEHDWDRILAALKRGQFCSKCKRTPPEILDQEGQAFGEHLTDVDGVAIPASAELIADKREKHEVKIDAARRKSTTATRRADDCHEGQAMERISEKEEEHRRRLQEAAEDGVAHLRFETHEERERARVLEGEVEQQRDSAAWAREQASNIDIGDGGFGAGIDISSDALAQLSAAYEEHIEAVQEGWNDRPRIFPTIHDVEVSQDDLENSVIDLAFDAANARMDDSGYGWVGKIDKAVVKHVRDVKSIIERLRGTDAAARADAVLAAGKKLVGTVWKGGVGALIQGNMTRAQGVFEPLVSLLDTSGSAKARGFFDNLAYQSNRSGWDYIRGGIHQVGRNLWNSLPYVSWFAPPSSESEEEY